MTSPRSTYGGGYYSAPSFTDTPIYDSLVAERGTPQIAPIRVPSAYDTGNHLPALPAALPALPAAPSHHNPSYGYGQAPQPAPLQQAPAPYIPQQAAGPRGYPGAQPQRPAGGTGYEAMRPAAPRPAPAPYEDPYNRPYRGY
ncbi:hypothetical protein DMA15_03310 [Streptomyces sp. WAC 01529]|uniref:DUF6643 family protein n=1 Tax=Streptomyces sp. WAC 01529 TaxID=2203205 RepID=UPI000F6BF64F|nr:DUF6643 family protein [Streptomyces sp. WAC 01529]AZM51724.1 hypothetical protein DMA15_03310 [Streptomyces sp. WAC 01529]